MAQQVVLLRLVDAVIVVDARAETARIEAAHGYIRRAVHHPLRQVLAGARSPGDTNLRAAAAPEIFQPRGTEQHVAVGRVRDRAVYHALDALVGQHRHAFQRVFQPRHDAIVIRLEQFVLGFPWSTVIPDRSRIGFLVDTDQA